MPFNRGRIAVSAPRHCALEIVGLGGGQYEIERPRQCVFGDDWRGQDIDIADSAADRGASPGQLGSASRTHEKGHLATGFEKPAAENPPIAPAPTTRMRMSSSCNTGQSSRQPRCCESILSASAIPWPTLMHSMTMPRLRPLRRIE